MRAFSSILIAIIMLSISIPIGILVVEKAREIGGASPRTKIPQLVTAYSFKNGEGYLVIIYNLGPGDARVIGIIDRTMSYINISIIVRERSLAQIRLGVGGEPNAIILEGGLIISVKSIS